MIQKINAPVTVKQCKSFVGMVNFVSIFCPDLQKLFKPIYDLTRKGRQFVWGKVQQDAFEEIKHRLQKPPVTSITELEMCGLAINIASFAHLLRKVDFDAVVDHLMITQIIRSNVELATNRIKRLLEVLSAYSFNLYYIKGKDMILSDFLSRQNISDEDTREIIPISFNMRSVLQDKYYNLDKDRERYMVQTR